MELLVVRRLTANTLGSTFILTHLIKLLLIKKYRDSLSQYQGSLISMIEVTTLGMWDQLQDMPA